MKANKNLSIILKFLSIFIFILQTFQVQSKVAQKKEITQIMYSLSSCVPIDFFDHEAFVIELYLSTSYYYDEEVYYLTNILGQIYNQKDELISESGTFFTALYSTNLLILSKRFKPSIGKYYIKTTDGYVDQDYISSYNGRSYPFEVTEYSHNFFISYEANTKDMIFTSYHGKVNKDDDLALQFEDEFNDDSEIPEVFIKDEKGSQHKLTCHLSNYWKRIVICEIREKYIANTLLALQVKTPCNSYDQGRYKYQEVSNVIQIESYETEKECYFGNDMINVDLKFKVVEGIEPEIGTEIENIVIRQLESFRYNLEKRNCTITSHFTITCTFSQFTSNEKISIGTIASNLIGKDTVLRPFIFKDIITMGDYQKHYVKTLNDTFTFDYAEKGNRINFDIYFSDYSSELSVPSIKVSGKSLSCYKPSSSNYLKCYFFYNDLLPSADGTPKTYIAEISGGSCQKDEISIIILDSRDKNITMNINSVKFESSCYTNKINIYTNYLTFYLNYTFDKEYSGSIEEFSIYLVSKENENTKIKADCQEYAENMLICKYNSYNYDFSEVNIYPKLPEAYPTENYIISQFSLKDTIYIPGTTFTPEYNSSENKLIIEPKFYPEDTKRIVTLTGSYTPKSGKPKLFIDGDEINCDFVEKKRSSELQCEISKARFPYNEETQETNYTGYLQDVCGEKYLDVILRVYPRPIMTINDIEFDQDCYIFNESQQYIEKEFIIYYNISNYKKSSVSLEQIYLNFKMNAETIIAWCSDYTMGGILYCRFDVEDDIVPGEYVIQINTVQEDFDVAPIDKKYSVRLSSEQEKNMPVEDELCIKAEFEEKASSIYKFYIEFNDKYNANDVIRIIFNLEKEDKEIDCKIDYPRYNYSVCLINKEDFPPGLDGQSNLYYGNIVTFCGEPYYQIKINSTLKEEEDKGKKSSKVGLIVGISVAVIVIVAAIIVFWIYRRSKNKESTDNLLNIGSELIKN